jgi:hypothetical protein
VSNPSAAHAQPTLDTAYAALQLPPEAWLDQRVPKKLFLEQLATQQGTTAADKKLVREELEEFRWLASLKPGTSGLAAYSDETREYGEIAVLAVVSRTEAKSDRLRQLIHRAVPYPVVLFLKTPQALSLSLAHKRKALNSEAGKPVLEELRSVLLAGNSVHPALLKDLLVSFALPSLTLPTRDMFSAYSQWMDRLVAFDSAAILNKLLSPLHGPVPFHILPSATHAGRHREAQRELTRLDNEETALRTRLHGEKQLSRKVESNLALKQLQQRRLELIALLRGNFAVPINARQD